MNTTRTLQRQIEASRQAVIRSFILDYLHQHQRPPLRKEIERGTGVSQRTINRDVMRMIERGELTHGLHVYAWRWERTA